MFVFQISVGEEEEVREEEAEMMQMSQRIWQDEEDERENSPSPVAGPSGY